MDIILLDKVENLGNLGDMVAVRAGYARNYLIPQGKAKFATTQNIAEFETLRAELERASEDAITVANGRKSQLQELVITVKANAGQEGKLFGSVGSSEIADAISATGIVAERREVRLPNGPLRMLGEYDVDLHLHSDVNATVKIIVEAVDE